jgi:hypothetical protein
MTKDRRSRRSASPDQLGPTASPVFPGSGPVLMSGAPLTRGPVLMSGAGVRSGFGDTNSPVARSVWEDAAAKGFLLAPRIYNLEVAPGEGSSEATRSNVKLPDLLGNLPAHLTFFQPPISPEGPTRQEWSSEDSGRWTWRLTVEPVRGMVSGRLVAQPSEAGPAVEPLVWRCEGPWDFFTTNRLLPEKRSPPEFDVVLIARAI